MTRSDFTSTTLVLVRDAWHGGHMIDMPGYGASRPRDMSPRWTKRRVGDALAALMTHLGHDRFAIVGHDRGARVGYRLALDHPTRVTAYTSLTVIPTADAMAAIDYRSAAHTFHWFFFAQEADLPERLLAADPDAFIAHALARMTDGRDVIEPAALDVACPLHMAKIFFNS